MGPLELTLTTRPHNLVNRVNKPSDLPASGWQRPVMRSQKPTFYVCDGCDSVFFHPPEACGEHQFCCEYCYDGWFRPKKAKLGRRDLVHLLKTPH
jgi:hypothetical protein